MGLVLEGGPKIAKNGLANGGDAGKSGNNIHLFYIGRHYPGCLWFFGSQKELMRKKIYLAKTRLPGDFM